ncbi:hypothetical protein R5H32_17025 [Defluviimonas sp. D31]|uniref:hypothetical protein n=1 Tax=Defluviimonas sp. D31 TaxID=3083253 RepID=UPI002970064A|nr:hypothetical protein [Defluviimonas sp. D31]MDW4551067.1 hypothetical protein [Defluviimonas sp. D31]
MREATVHEKAGRIADLLEDRLGIRGDGLAEKLRRGGRGLSRKLRRDAGYLARAAEEDQVPKLRVRLDHERIASAYDRCLRELEPIGAGLRRKALVMDILTGIATGLLVTALVVAALLSWRGFL